MDSQLYRIVYCSQNRIKGTADSISADVAQILARSRVNNAAESVTGALLYNSGNFAQVLEGPLPSIGRIFERIQRDMRHSEVTIVQSGPVDQRQFPEWSMAFAGSSSAHSTPVTAAAFEAAFGHSVNAGEQILEILRTLVVREDEWSLVVPD